MLLQERPRPRCFCCCGSDPGRDALPAQPHAITIARKRTPTENQVMLLLLWERPWSRCSTNPTTCHSHRAQARSHRKPRTAVAVVGATLVAMLHQPSHLPQPSRASALPQKTRDCRCCCGSDLGRDALPAAALAPACRAQARSHNSVPGAPSNRGISGCR